jgi:hypothetical protein
MLLDTALGLGEVVVTFWVKEFLTIKYSSHN